MKKKGSSILLLLFIGATALWYFGHYRPAQSLLKAEPQKIYKTTTPRSPVGTAVKAAPPGDTTPPPGREAEVAAFTPVEDRATQERTTASTPEETALLTTATPDVSNAATPVQEAEVVPADAGAPEDSESEISKRLKKEASVALSEAAILEKEAHTALAHLLKRMPVEKQRTVLEEMKAEFLSARHPLTHEPLFENLTEAERAWDSMFDGIVKAGYTPPLGRKE